MAKMGIGNDSINECLNYKQTDRMTRVWAQDRREGEQAVGVDKLGSKLSQLNTAEVQCNIVKFPHTSDSESLRQVRVSPSSYVKCTEYRQNAPELELNTLPA